MQATQAKQAKQATQAKQAKQTKRAKQARQASKHSKQSKPRIEKHRRNPYHISSFPVSGHLEIWPLSRPPRGHQSTQEVKSVSTDPARAPEELLEPNYGRFCQKPDKHPRFSDRFPARFGPTLPAPVGGPAPAGGPHLAKPEARLRGWPGSCRAGRRVFDHRLVLKRSISRPFRPRAGWLVGGLVGWLVGW